MAEGGIYIQAANRRNYPGFRFRIPFILGGGGDTVAKLLAQGLSERLGKQFVADNRTGASTMIGSEMVAKAPPDGYTLLLGVSTLAINPAMFRKVPYDALRTRIKR